MYIERGAWLTRFIVYVSAPQYHTGFRHQVTSWPSNPVDHYVDTLSRYRKGSVVVDLGCGDAALAKALVPKGYNVLSYDLVSTDAWVVEVDMCARLPLPGSEDGGESGGYGQIVDVVVCSLSLMNTNWLHSIREARRVLKKKWGAPLHSCKLC